MNMGDTLVITDIKARGVLLKKFGYSLLDTKQTKIFYGRATKETSSILGDGLFGTKISTENAVDSFLRIDMNGIYTLECLHVNFDKSSSGDIQYIDTFLKYTPDTASEDSKCARIYNPYSSSYRTLIVIPVVKRGRYILFKSSSKASTENFLIMTDVYIFYENLNAKTQMEHSTIDKTDMIKSIEKDGKSINLMDINDGVFAMNNGSVSLNDKENLMIITEQTIIDSICLTYEISNQKEQNALKVEFYTNSQISETVMPNTTMSEAHTICNDMNAIVIGKIQITSKILLQIHEISIQLTSITKPFTSIEDSTEQCSKFKDSVIVIPESIGSIHKGIGLTGENLLFNDLVVIGESNGKYLECKSIESLVPLKVL
ncbi:DgyrCDS3210 [Dimorphilus gyrociliatus]|uniref:DgyrCDS3210 n=1 Tax=Dimorphilus gyrociliatus TaxID=2664684 RepID=A0A7I8VD35_9ANNE|nr:DgyrCDS3210 [Dimorphilus gyrociliatus]